MEAYSTTTDLKNYYLREEDDDNDDEGFAEVEVESLIVPKPEVQDDLVVPKPTSKPKVLYREPKLKLTFIGKERSVRDDLRKSILQKQERSAHGRSLDTHKRDSRRSLQLELLSECVVKIRRTVVADNISIPTFSLSDSKAVKGYILGSNCTLVYEQPKEINTHGFLRTILENNPDFIDNPLNQLLKMKLKESFIMPKKSGRPNPPKPLQFQGDYEGANLEFVAEAGQDDYELYLRNDTNTHGHQSWFLFRLRHSRPVTRTVTLTVCNLKRNLTMFTEGARVCTRKLNEAGRGKSEWIPAGSNYQFKVINNPKFTNTRVYRLTFQLALEPDSLLEVALLPAYIYSDMLNDITRLESCNNLSCSILTYSLVGLAIPLLTFTRGDSPHKQVILVSSRIHPGQANASYMCRGLMKWLAEDTPQTHQFLEKHIVKVVPMINPDGVLFGNFRTNFLGVDLNRSFDSQDELTNPEIVALKELGAILKQEHGKNFNLFLDLHGHSSERNIFTYGPDYDSTETNYYQIRLLPKILNLRSKMFKYHCCSFKLEQYKRHTARGYFLNNIGLLGYTIEASYAFYQEESKLNAMGHRQWTQFGVHLAEGLHLLSKISKFSGIRNKSQIKKALGEADKEQVDIIRKFKKEFKVEKEMPKPQDKTKEKGAEDSDGEGDCEDYTRVEKEEVMRRVAETVAPNLILPRVLKPAILYPTVTPKLFKYRQDCEQTQLKILYTKRTSKYTGMRQAGNGYIHSLKGIDMLRPDAKHLLL